MAARRGLVLYLGTEEGLYAAEAEGDGFSARLLGFRGMGIIRAPVLIDSHDPAVLYAGTTRAGMFRSRDRGETWQEINRGIVYKDVWSIAQHPTTGTLFAGTSPADVFISEDQGDTWTECAHLQTLPTTRQWHGPVPPHVSRMKGLALSMEDPRLLYGAIEEGWAVRSLDGGKTWEQVGNGIDHDGHSIAAMPTTPRVVVASTGKGMFRTEDGGEHWLEANQGMESHRYTAAPLVAHPARPDVLACGVTAVGPGQWGRRPEGAESAFARSDDQGRSWCVFSQGLPQPCVAVLRALAVDPEELDTYFGGMTDGTVWVSNNRGESFRRVLGDLPPVMTVTVGRA
jgi:photosystem II stability/assembly factor-like uncharacterized protein